MSYTDLTAAFSYKLRLTYQLMTELAENDAENHIPSGTVWAFFQAAAPTGWVKQITHTDKVLRCVSGAGGGNGGTVSLSAGVPLAHSHTVNAHTHSFPSHQHQWGYATQASKTVTTTSLIGDAGAGTAIRSRDNGGSGQNITRELKAQTVSSGSGTTGSASPGTDTQPSNPVLAYADVIICSKT